MRSKKNVTNKYGKRIYYRVAVIGMAAALLCVRGYTGSYASSRERLCAAGQESGFVLDAQAATDSGEKQDGKEELQLYAGGCPHGCGFRQGSLRKECGG